MNTENVDGLLRIYEPGHDVVLNYDSGDRRMFSPNGLRLLFESSSQGYQIDLSENHVQRIQAVDIGKTQWNHEGVLSCSFGDPIPLQAGPQPIWEAWFPGDQDGDRFLHSTHRAYYSKNNEPWTLCLWDSVTGEIVEQFSFEDAMPGATWSGRPHYVGYIPEEETFFCQLSAYANPGWDNNAIYAFGRDGIPWQLAGSETWSHPTFSGEKVAFGRENAVWIGSWKSNDFETAELSESYGHGTMIGNHIAFSNSKRFVNEIGEHRARDTQVIRINTDDSRRQVIRDIPNPTDLYAERARPTISHDGTKVAWNERHDGHACVMVWGLGQEEDACARLLAENDYLKRIITDANLILDLGRQH